MLHLSTIRQHYNLGFKSVVSLVEELEQKIEALILVTQSPNHFQHLERTISHQQEEIKRLSQTVDNKSKELFELYQFNQRLQLKIRELELTLATDSPSLVRKDSHNSNLPPSLDLPWQKVKRTRSLRTKSGLQIGGQPGHRGYTLLQVHNPDVMIVHQANVCQHCHYSLIDIAPIRSNKRQIFEIENGKLNVIEHQAEVKLCPFCQEISKGHFPEHLKAPVQYGTSVFSRIVYLNQYQLLPVARTAECMNDLFECPISLATIGRAVKFCSDKLIRSEQRIKVALRNSSVLGVDETGIRINGINHWVHVSRTDDLVHLAFHSKRGKEAIEEIGIINQFTGTLVRDGWFSYNWYQQCRHSLCNIHLLRDLRFIAEAYPENKQWTEAFAKLLLEIKEAVEIAVFQDKIQLDSSLRTNFLTRYDSILTGAEPIIRGSPESKNKTLSAPSLHRRLIRNKDLFLRFMTDFSVPFDNNGAERDLRMLKLQQKISGCFRTIEGVKTFCRIRSYLSSSRKQGRGLLNAIESASKGKPIALTA